MRKLVIYNLIIFFILILVPLNACAKKETLILLDQSASMYEPYEDELKFYYAKKAVINILNSLNDSEYIGLRTIGMNPERLRARGRVSNYTLCTSTEKLNNIMPNNKESIEMSLYGIIPSGTSPIEFVLNKSINEDFSDDADIKQIILVTDGYENCNGDPCNFIRKLMQTRKDIKINVVSLGASEKDIIGLKCLTSATNGNFININTPYELEKSIEYITNKMDSDNIKFQTNKSKQTYNTNKIEYKNYLMEFNE